MLEIRDIQKGLVLTAFWEAKPGEADAIADILRQFSSKAQSDTGVKAFVVHRSKDEPSKFFFYEVFENEDALNAHQETPHFKSMIADKALPKLAKRERAQYSAL